MAYNKNITKRQAQKKLLSLWFTLSGILLFGFFVFSASGRFGSKNLEAWEWLAQNLLPSLSLMATAFTNYTKDQSFNRQVDRFHYKVAYRLSLTYLSILLLVIPIAPFVTYTIIDWMNIVKAVLIPIQGFVTCFIGLIFLSKN